ncbi:glyoxylate pathway regulator [Ceratobasidium sp. AG-Ba]|nr:glyoxylate pathway regulator [Ceratobasidium sp. AG-Ba]QRV91769.1 glyoxylate pathway regulator [Ceratobasidium sp. AG-Ba]
MADLEKQPKTIDEAPVAGGSNGEPTNVPAASPTRSILRPLPEYDGTQLDRTNSNDTQRAFPTYKHRKLGNPSPLGLMSFASTLLMYSLYNLRTRHIDVPNVVVGMAMGIGGLTQLLAGMWEFAEGNSLGATGFSCYGGFWISYALINWPGTGVAESYVGDAAKQAHDALGIYFMVWFLLTIIIFMGSFRSSVALASKLGFLTLTFLLLMIGSFQQKVSVMKAAGVFGAITSFISYYIAASALYSPETGYIHLPVGELPKKLD